MIQEIEVLTLKMTMPDFGQEPNELCDRSVPKDKLTRLEKKIGVMANWYKDMHMIVGEYENRTIQSVHTTGDVDRTSNKAFASGSFLRTIQLVRATVCVHPEFSHG